MRLKRLVVRPVVATQRTSPCEEQCAPPTSWSVTALMDRDVALHKKKILSMGKKCRHKHSPQNLWLEGSQGSLGLPAHTDTGILSSFSASPFSR